MQCHPIVVRLMKVHHNSKYNQKDQLIQANRALKPLSAYESLYSCSAMPKEAEGD